MSNYKLYYNHKLYVKLKSYGNFFNSWIDKKILLHKMSYFAEPDHNKNEIKTDLDLSNYAKKS